MKDFALIKLHDNLTHFKQELALNSVNEVLPAIIHKISKTPPFYFKIGKGPLEITSKEGYSKLIYLENIFWMIVDAALV